MLKRQWFVLVAAGVLLLVACNTLRQPAEPDHVVLQLKWLHNPQFAGFYVAQEKGYYAEENIELTLVPGGFEADVIGRVVSGEAQFGIWLGDVLLEARVEEQPVKAVAAILQINPTCYFSLAETGIEKPADLAGKRIAYRDYDYLLPSVLQTAGLTLDDVEHYPLDVDMTPLLEGKADVWAGFLTDQVVTLQEQGYQVNFILADDYGAQTYSDVLFTTETLIEENPDLVQRFVRATLRGWEYALAHPDEAVEATIKFDSSLDRAHNQAIMHATTPLVDTGQTPIGMMDEAVWQSTQRIMLEQGLISSSVDLDALYTNEFVEKAQ